MQTFLEHLTDQELSDRLAKLQSMAAETQKLLIDGQRGDLVSILIRNGRRFFVYRNEAAFNSQNSAIKNTKLEIDNRAAVR